MFSGYWNAAETTARDFRGGYFHMGDIFVELPDGRFRYVDRSKYLIKSGGENIYPLEIERVLHTDPGVIEAVVVRKKDDRWGEVPVAFVAVEGDHMGLFDVLVMPEARRRGLARKITESLYAWAWGHGARFAYLQVVATNQAAMPLYAGQGFRTVYEYEYRVPPQP